MQFAFVLCKNAWCSQFPHPFLSTKFKVKTGYLLEAILWQLNYCYVKDLVQLHKYNKLLGDVFLTLNYFNQKLRFKNSLQKLDRYRTAEYDIIAQIY